MSKEKVIEGLGGGVVGFFKRILKIQHDDTGYVELNGGKRLYCLTSAITANSTTTSAPAGSIGVTSHATGKSKLFISDASKWQKAAFGGSAIAALTDNSGGATADGTIGAITTGTPASLAAQAAINTEIRDAIKELATKVNEIIAA